MGGTDMGEKKCSFGILLISLFIFQGCATIVHGTGEEISIGSTPSGATVIVDSQEKGKTPLVVDCKRKDSHKIRIELAGYEPYEINLETTTSGWFLGNIIFFGGPVGFGVDSISGGEYNLYPKQVQATLAKAALSHRNETDELVNAVKNGNYELTETLLKNGGNVNAREQDSGNSLLITAAWNGQLEMVKLLITKGADLNLSNDSGVTALIGASYKGHEKVVRELLSHGADKDIKDKHGNTALDLAKMHNNTSLVKLLSPDT
jgi:hypothetical protein